MNTNEEINSLKEKLDFIYSKLNIEEKKKRIDELTSISMSENFWKDVDNANKVMEELNSLQKESNMINDLYNRVNNAKDMLDIVNDDELDDLEKELTLIKKEISDLEIETLFDGEYDNNNAYIEIHSGAGGTESNDWADMLYRMYTRYLSDNNFKYEVISIQPGEEVGIKGVFLHVCGIHAFGKLKGETGVHRLVRISPFDAGKRRHTSFASVLVTPEISKNINVDIKDSDVKIDVYRSSGAGGQSVNTTDSAVRITHLPTGIVVTVQNERSQLKNKEKALEILRSKLYALEQEKFDDKLKGLKGDVMDVNFGSATRSYVMCPYTLVKDNITGCETPNVKKVLDGDIEIFIDSYLRKNKSSDGNKN
jgi:peptide chain release factor 2